MKSITINGIIINCLFAELTEEQKQQHPQQQQAIQQYKDFQLKAVEDYFKKPENTQPLINAAITNIDVQARIEYLKPSEKFTKGIHSKNLIPLPMGLVFYEPALQKVKSIQKSGSGIRLKSRMNAIMKKVSAKGKIKKKKK